MNRESDAQRHRESVNAFIILSWGCCAFPRKGSSLSVFGASSHPSFSYMNSYQVWVHMWSILPFSRKDRLLAPTIPRGKDHVKSIRINLEFLSDSLILSWASLSDPFPCLLSCMWGLSFHSCVFEFICCHVWITSTFYYFLLASFFAFLFAHKYYFLKYNLFIWFYVLGGFPVCMSVRRCWILKSQTIISSYVVAGNWTLILWKGSQYS